MLKLLPQPSTPREATNIVRRNIDEGADIIKLFTGSNVSPARVLPMPDDVAVAAVAAEVTLTLPCQISALSYQISVMRSTGPMQRPRANVR